MTLPKKSDPVPQALLESLSSMRRFTPFTRRRRLLIAAFAVAATTLILGSMLAAHVDYLRAKLALGLPDAPPCAAGQTSGCVGGTMEVTVLPAAPAASR